MPAEFTHYLVARETYKALPENIQKSIDTQLPLYFFGAQGADFCFFYKFLQPHVKNFGSYLHREGGYQAFQILQVFSEHDVALKAYALGFITHYATDVLFHPYVYAMAGKSRILHSKIEGSFDVYFKDKLRPLWDSYAQYYRKPLLSKEENELFLLYSVIAADAGFPPLSQKPFSHAIKLFNAYPPLSSALLTNNSPAFFKRYLNIEKKEWSYPADPAQVRTDGCEELFLKSVSFARSLCEDFLFATQTRTPLSKSQFGKNYLSGI